MSALIGTAVTTIALSAFLSHMTTALKGTRSLELRGSREEARQIIRQGANCQKTLAGIGSLPGQCTGANEPVTVHIPILRSDGSVLVNAAPDGNGTQLGEWRIKAYCTKDAAQATIPRRYLNILISRRDSAGTVLQDPLSKRLQDWTTVASAGPLCSQPLNREDPPDTDSIRGQIFRCPYRSDGVNFEVPRFDPGWGAQREVPGFPVNPYSQTQNCPDGFTPVHTWEMLNEGCENNRYIECSWDAQTGVYFDQSAYQAARQSSSQRSPAALSDFHGNWVVTGAKDSSGDSIVSWRSRRRGCGRVTYLCLRVPS